jgi:hypothetical protein
MTYLPASYDINTDVIFNDVEEALKDFAKRLTNTHAVRVNPDFIISGGIIPTLFHKIKSLYGGGGHSIYDPAGAPGTDSDIDIFCANSEYARILYEYADFAHEGFTHEVFGKDYILNGKTTHAYNIGKFANGQYPHIKITPRFHPTERFRQNLRCKNLQIIHSIGGTPEEIVNTFDMEHLKAFYCSKSRKLHITDLQKSLIVRKHILPTEAYYRQSTKQSQRRFQKYTDRGYRLADSTELVPNQKRIIINREEWGLPPLRQNTK